MFYYRLETVIFVICWLIYFFFNYIKDPAAKRRAALEESLRWHEFNFELDAEMQWIKEHMPLATSKVGTLIYENMKIGKKKKDVPY